MKKTLTSALVIMAIPLMVHAQDSSDDSNTSTAQDLALGEQIVDGVVVGSTYLSETFDDWNVRCVRTADKKDPCQMYQLIQDDNDTSVAEISLFPLPAGQQAVLGATVAVPLGTLLTEQLTMAVDSSNTKRYPFSWCTVQGCFARIGLTAEDVSHFKQGANVDLSIVPVAAADQRVNLSMSLKGFTAALESVRASNLANASE